MTKCSLNTGFSKYGLIAVALVFLPYLLILFPSKNFLLNELAVVPRWLYALYILSTVALSATLALIDNSSALPFSVHSRAISIAFIILGIYYICWVYFLIGTSDIMSILFKILSPGFFLFFSFDRKNWIAFGFSVLFLILGLVLSILVFCV